MQLSDYRNLACTLLRGECSPWPDTVPTSQFIDFTQSQGILLLLDSHLEQIEKSYPKSIVQAVAIAQSAAEKLEYYRFNTIRDLFKQFQDNQIDALLFKGAANAYLLYDSPLQRQHVDADVLIKVEDYSSVINILAQTGFTTDPIKPTKFGPYQTTAILSQSAKPNILIDLHWKINNRLLLADVLSFNELWSNALKINQYAENAKGLGYADALLIASIHDAGSLPVERNKMIGLYDVHLLMNKLDRPGIQATLARALEKGIGKICLDYLSKAVNAFGDDHQQKMLADIKADIGPVADEPSAKLLVDDRSWFDDQKLDLQAVEGLSTKFEYIISKLSRKLKNQ